MADHEAVYSMRLYSSHKVPCGCTQYHRAKRTQFAAVCNASREEYLLNPASHGECHTFIFCQIHTEGSL